MAVATIRPTHRAIQTYYDELQAYSAQNVAHETAVRTAFLNLLAETGKARQGTLVPELSLKVGGRTIRPDGTLRDEGHFAGDLVREPGAEPAVIWDDSCDSPSRVGCSC